MRREAAIAILIGVVAGCGSGRGGRGSAGGAKALAPTPTGSGGVGIEATVAAVTDGEEPLVGEERERDPRSATIKIKIAVDPRRKAHVLWGRKDFGEAPLEIERPRNSGPLDLVVVAPGYLPYHTRVFTDRDDKLALRLYSEIEAPQLFGYRSVPEPIQKSLEIAPKNASSRRLDRQLEKK